MRVLVINGSYRDDGVTDQALNVAIEMLRHDGAIVDVVNLRHEQLSFCLNCRTCMQEPGDSPGHCVLEDNMADIVRRIEMADAYVLAAPTNFGSVTALFKQFMERLSVYAYWPWSKPYPTFRKANNKRKKAMLISSCAAPGLLGRLAFSNTRQLRSTAETIGARSVGSVVIGHSDSYAHAEFPPKLEEKLGKVAHRLAA